MLLNPIAQWWRKGPVGYQMHKFMWSNAPLHYKFSMLAYMSSYCECPLSISPSPMAESSPRGLLALVLTRSDAGADGIAAGMTISLLNYVLLGLQFDVDGYYMHSFEIWLATAVVFFGSGTVGFTLFEYRLGERSLVSAFLSPPRATARSPDLISSDSSRPSSRTSSGSRTCASPPPSPSCIRSLTLVPVAFPSFFLFGGLAIPVSQALLAHTLSYNMTWGATSKEVERSNFFKEVPKMLRRYWFSWLLSWVVAAGMVVLATPLVPVEWRIGGDAWGVIFPLAVSVGCHILAPVSRMLGVRPEEWAVLMMFFAYAADRAQPVVDDLLLLILQAFHFLGRTAYVGSVRTRTIMDIHDSDSDFTQGTLHYMGFHYLLAPHLEGDSDDSRSPSCVYEHTWPLTTFSVPDSSCN